MWGAIIAGLAMIVTQIISQSQQNKQQQKLTKIQTDAQKDLTGFNQGVAIDTWDKTNVDAQRKQMEKAGLNVGLMYQGKGGSGTTTTTPGSVAGGMASPQSFDAGPAIGMGMEAVRQKAEIKNIDANTTKTEAETAKITGVDTAKTGAETTSLMQGVENAKLQNAIMQYEKGIKEVEANIKEKTQEDVLKQIAAVSDKAVGEAISSRAKGEVDEQTYNDKIEQIKQDTKEQQIRMAAQKTNIKVSEQSIRKLANEINMASQNNMREWDKMVQTDKEIHIKQMLSAAQISLMGAQELKQWTGMINDIMGITIKAPRTKSVEKIKKGEGSLKWED